MAKKPSVSNNSSSSDSEFVALMESRKIDDIKEDVNIVIEGQYKYAYEAMMDAYNAGLFVGLVGPGGCGKTEG